MGQVVIGIDVDSKKVSAVITTDGENPILRQKVLPVNVPVARWLDSAWCWTYKMSKQYAKPGHRVYVFIEAPFVSPKTINAAVPLARLNGALLAGAERGGAVTQPVIITAWKKDIIGKGNASKPEIVAWCKMYWRNVYDEAMKKKPGMQQDLMDAAAINRHGVNVVKRMDRIEQHYKNHPDEALDRK